MLLREPAPTQADLHFRVLGFPVRVHPLFWVVTLMLGMQSDAPADPSRMFVWVAVVFVSILIHELGHAVIQSYFGGHPWITLYSFGGLASCSDCDRRPRSQILISLAGPFAGFFFAGFIVSILYAIQRITSVQFFWIPVFWKPFESRLVNEAIWQLQFVNIAWGLVNLLPIYPLDGGQISRQLFLVWNPWRGVLYSLYVSFAVGTLVAGYAILQKDYYLALMFGFLAYGSYQSIDATRNPWR